jgi:hypothetical protein
MELFQHFVLAGLGRYHYKENISEKGSYKFVVGYCQDLDVVSTNKTSAKRGCTT